MISDNMPTNASLSTMWAMKNFTNLGDFFATSRHIGCQKIELNHQVDSAMLAEVSLDHYQFSGVHEPCPSDISTRDLVNRDWLISAQDETLRKRGVDTVKKSIDLAHELSAPVVVVHCGTIPVITNNESKLQSLFRSGKGHSAEYQEIKVELEQARQNLASPRLQAVKKSLAELVEYASQLKVQLGLENRYHYNDIPSINEMGDLLQLADASQLGFIYDVGHAQALDRLGFYAHEDWLKRYAHRMIGAHLHDVRDLSDHQAPGLGEIDFKLIAGYLPEGAFRTLELEPGNTLAQVQQGMKLLVDTGCIKYI